MSIPVVFILAFWYSDLYVMDYWSDQNQGMGQVFRQIIQLPDKFPVAIEQSYHVRYQLQE